MNLDEIEARAVKATRAPWCAGELAVSELEGGVLAMCIKRTEDAHFIASARADIPLLCLEIRRLMAQVAAMREKAVHEREDGAGWDCAECCGFLAFHGESKSKFKHDPGCVFGGGEK